MKSIIQASAFAGGLCAMTAAAQPTNLKVDAAPDGGITLLLLGVALTGLWVVRRIVLALWPPDKR